MKAKLSFSVKIYVVTNKNQAEFDDIVYCSIANAALKIETTSGQQNEGWQLSFQSSLGRRMLNVDLKFEGWLMT